MSGFIQGEDRFQATLFPERLDDYVAEDSSVRVIDVFLDDLDLSGLGFKTQPNDTGRPAYHPSTMLKLFVYGYLNRVQSSRRLEIEAQRNVELMWLTGRLAPDFKTIADFRKDNGVAIRLVCREFVMLCKKLNLFANAFVAIDGSKFKAVNNRDRNFTRAKMKRRLTRWEHEEVLDAAQARLDRSPDMMRIRRATVEHPFGTLKAWIGSTHFLTKTLDRVSTEMSLHALAYNMKRMMNIIGTKPLIEAIRA
jgi:transposase